MLSSIWDAICSIVSTLLDLASAIASAISTVLELIFEPLFDFLAWFLTDFLPDLGSVIFDILELIFEPLFDFITWFLTDFIPDLIAGIGEILLSVFETMIDAILLLPDFFSSIVEFLGSMLSYINPFSDNFFGYTLIELLYDLLVTVFKYLFVPDDDYFSSYFESLQNRLNEVFPFYDYLEQLEEVETNSTDISTSITISGISIFGQSISSSDYIDLSIFNNYKETWYTWCRVFIYILLVLYNINEVIKLMRGVNAFNGSGKSAEPTGNTSNNPTEGNK